MSVYTTTFGKELMRAIGAPFTRENDRYLRAWAQSEGSMATFNPFATTQPAPTGTKYPVGMKVNFNSVGVKNYPTWEIGVAMTAKTLLNGKYEGIVRALRSGRSAMDAAKALAASPWGTGDLTIRVLASTAGPREFPFGNCYPVPPAAYNTSRVGGIKIGSVGRDVDELLRHLAKRAGVPGFKWYDKAAAAEVDKYVRLRPSLWPADGTCGPKTFAGITGHP